MQVRRFSSGDRSGQDPEWYWKAGLHDAKVIRVDQLVHDHDYRLAVPHRNSLVIHLNASGALFDTKVTAIVLKNYKILRDDSALGGYPDCGIAGCYWMQDVLSWENGKFKLEIILLGEDDFRFDVQFDEATVYRK